MQFLLNLWESDVLSQCALWPFLISAWTFCPFFPLQWLVWVTEAIASVTLCLSIWMEHELVWQGHRSAPFSSSPVPRLTRTDSWPHQLSPASCTDNRHLHKWLCVCACVCVGRTDCSPLWRLCICVPVKHSCVALPEMHYCSKEQFTISVSFLNLALSACVSKWNTMQCQECFHVRLWLIEIQAVTCKMISYTS